MNKNSLPPQVAFGHGLHYNNGKQTKTLWKEIWKLWKENNLKMLLTDFEIRG